MEEAKQISVTHTQAALDSPYPSLGSAEITSIQQLIISHPDWGRQQLAQHLCARWNWRRPNGSLRLHACLNLLSRFQRLGKIQLPRAKTRPGRRPRPCMATPPPASPSDFPSAAVNLDTVVVRPVQWEERWLWRQLMQQHHYLGFHTIVGESLCYVATAADRWVALLGWGAAALKNRHRDNWIGWPPSLQWRRLSLIANNTRFLILPPRRQKNLASRILALNLKRLSADWQQRYHHPILLAETFVDPSRYTGACYRAAGWLALGETRGFAKQRGGYQPHGHPKLLLVRPLRPDAAAVLSAPFLPPLFTPDPEEPLMMDVNLLPLEGNQGLVDLVKSLVDPRKPRGVRHPIHAIVSMAICACLSGAKSFQALADWAQPLTLKELRRFGSKRHQAPSEPTFRRVLQRLDPQLIDDQVGQWLLQQIVLSGQGIALDGKTLRGGYDGDGKAPHLLSALLHGEGLVVAQQAVDEKTNEIPRVEPLLDPLAIEGCVVTADSLHTQKNTARYLVEVKHADYVFTVKDNQPTLKQDIEDLQLEAFPPSVY